MADTELERLARIEEKLEQLVRALDKELPALEARITKVERMLWVAVGMATASGAPQVVQLFGG